MNTTINAFASLVELKHVILRNNFEPIRAKKRWTINNKIMHEYEQVENKITSLKVNRYNQMKMKNANKVMQCRLEDKGKANDWYDTLLLESQKKKLDADNQLTNVAFQRENENNQLEEEIKNTSNEYHAYLTSATEFLNSIQYDYHNSKYHLTLNDIVTADAYQEYLKSCFHDVVKLSKEVIDYRILDDNEYKKVTEKIIYLPYQNQTLGRMHFDEHYTFTNSAQMKAKQEILTYLVNHLYLLLCNIEPTYMFLNSIIKSYIVNCEFKQLQVELNNTLFKYRDNLIQNQPVLSTSWWELFKNRFVSKNYKGETLLPFNKTMLYMAYFFESNKIQNDLTIYAMSDHNEDIDYVYFLFGPKIVFKQEYIRSQLESIFAQSFEQTSRKEGGEEKEEERGEEMPLMDKKNI